MSKYHVELDEKICIGCRACTVACHNFVPNGDKAKVVKHEIEQSELKANKEGAEACPVNCITLTKIEDEE
ncbi:MAG TPA: ferredoxin [Alphaproteobacteria bacterium]|nr:ferredoxin [Alphaproteobacteria bacterium]